MKNTFLSLAFLAVMALFMTGCDSSSSNNEANNSDTVAVDQTTEQIIENEVTEPADMIYYAFMNNYMQTTLGQVAEQKASSENVKNLGNDLVEENKQVLAQIEELATAANITLPTGLQVEDQQRLDSLSNLSGQQFDSVYVNMVVEQKNKTIELMQDLAANADNPIVRGLADDIISTEREQIERAEIVQQEMM